MSQVLCGGELGELPGEDGEGCVCPSAWHLAEAGLQKHASVVAFLQNLA